MNRLLFKTRKQEQSRTHTLQFRLQCLIILICILSLLLASRLYFMQVHEYKHYETLSLKNQLSIIPIPPPRGIILDRNGVVLAENLPVYAIEITPERTRDIPKTLQALQKLLPAITDEDIENFQHIRLQNHSFTAIPLKLKLNEEEVALFASQQYRFPGVDIKARLMRNYPLGELTAHVLGYVSRINIDELKQVDPVNYRGTDFMGKSGIEKYYESTLHGQVGYQKIETDVSGRTIRVLHKIQPTPGKKIYTTLDMRLQKAAYDALEGKRGAVVAIDPRNGEVLVLASAPSFDPNHFVNGVSQRNYQALANAKNRPLYNRAVRGLYPPASTVKPYVALAGLENGVVDTQYSISDPGWYRLPNVKHVYHDWKKYGHGMVNVHRAIMMSCDTYFFQLGHRMGITPLTNMLDQFGFGKHTGIDLAEEAPGILPSITWKQNTKHQPWYPGDTLITSIGQGFMLASPLQIANAVATFSQKGVRYQPHLLLQSVSANPHQITPFVPHIQHRIQLTQPEHWNIVKEAMHAVITSNEGTGYRFGRTAPYSVAAKTGTAQVFSGRQYVQARYEDIPEFLRDHSLFIAFAPVESPEIAIAVMVENDVVAASVARHVFDTYFALKSNEQPIS